jgi:GNAT superfamily N-acetyltransferase
MESSMMFKIRKAEKADIPEIQNLMNYLTGHEMGMEEMRDRFRMIETSPIDELYLLEYENRVHGLLGFRIRENLEERSRYGEVSVIVTLPESRKLGFGRALMDFAENLAKDKGCKGTWLVNGFGREEEAHKFYTKLGYQVTGYRFVKSF